MKGGGGGAGKILMWPWAQKTIVTVNCICGLPQGLLEMVSAKIAEWIAEFVEDFVRLNPALLPNPASPAPAALGCSPRPSPRVSGRSSFTSIQLEPSAHSAGNSGGGLGSLFDAAAAAGSSPAAATAAGTTMHSPRGGAPVSAGVSLAGSFSSRLQASSGAGSGSSSSTGGGSSGRPLVPPAALRSASPEPTQAPHVPPLPPKGTHAAAPAEVAAEATERCDEDTIGATPPGSTASPATAAAAAAGDGSGSRGAAGLVTHPKPKGLFRQLVGGPKGARAPKPLTNRYAKVTILESTQHMAHHSCTVDTLEVLLKSHGVC